MTRTRRKNGVRQGGEGKSRQKFLLWLGTVRYLERDVKGGGGNDGGKRGTLAERAEETRFRPGQLTLN